MTENPNTTPPRPIMARAAENGLYISGFICLLLLLLGAGTTYIVFAQLFLIGAVVMPFLAYRILSRNCRLHGGYLSFAEIWAEGIASFFLGSLIPAVMAYVLLRFAFPDFIYGQVQTSIDILRQVDAPEADTIADTLEQLRERGAVPSAADISANIISFNIVAGTVLSLFMAIALSTRMRMQRYRNNNKL